MRNTVYVPYEKEVTVYEHKASTDESVKLLNEFGEKAKENLCYSVRINQTYLDAVAMFFREDYLDNGFEVYFKFGLNGTEFKIKSFISDDDWDSEMMKNPLGEPPINIALKLVHQALSEEIAKQLLMANVSELNKAIKYR